MFLPTDYLLKDLKIRTVKSDISNANIVQDHSFIGQVIDNRYTIKEYLGYGTYGKVFTLLDSEDNKM